MAWSVGSQGTNLGSMSPRMLLQLLQYRRQQGLAQEQQAAIQYQRDAASQEREALLRQMSPEDQKDAQIYGLPYVREKKMRQAEWDRQDAVRKAAIEQAKNLGKQQVAGITSDILQGRAAPRVEGLESERVPSPQEMQSMLAQTGARASGATAEPLNEAMRPDVQAAQQAPIQHYRIIEPSEQAILEHAGARIPEGTISRKDYEDALIQQGRNEAMKAKQAMEAKKEAAAQSALDTMEKAASGTPFAGVVALARSSGMKPSQVYQELTKHVESYAKKEEDKAGKALKLESEKAKSEKAEAKDFRGNLNSLLKEVDAARNELAATTTASTTNAVGIKQSRTVPKLNPEQRKVWEEKRDRAAHHVMDVIEERIKAAGDKMPDTEKAYLKDILNSLPGDEGASE